MEAGLGRQASTMFTLFRYEKDLDSCSHSSVPSGRPLSNFCWRFPCLIIELPSLESQATTARQDESDDRGIQ